jgi:hypothetical protein
MLFYQINASTSRRQSNDRSNTVHLPPTVASIIFPPKSAQARFATWYLQNANRKTPKLLTTKSGLQVSSCGCRCAPNFCSLQIEREVRLANTDLQRRLTPRWEQMNRSMRGHDCKFKRCQLHAAVKGRTGAQRLCSEWERGESSSHVVAIEVVGVSSSGKAAGRERVLGLGGVVHADYDTAAAAQVQHCLRSAA